MALLVRVAKWGARSPVLRARVLSTMASPPVSSSRPNLIQQPKRPNLIMQQPNHKQRRDYEAVLLEEEESLIPGNNTRSASAAAALVYDSIEKQQVEPRTFDSDLIVVLDMDECLIHSQFMSRHDVAAKWAHQVARRRNDSLFNGDFHPMGRVESFRISLPDGDLVQVNKRPYLEEFLEQVTSTYETHVFTAAMEVYASPVLDNLDPYGTRFAKRWYRESCAFDESTGAYVKDLANLDLPNTRSHRTVLVDNNPLSFLANPANGILVSNFYDDPSDNTLTHVVDLLHELNDMDDVRPELTKRFRLEEALQDLLEKQKKEEEELM